MKTKRQASTATTKRSDTKGLILCGTDFSAPAEEAGKVAVAIGKRLRVPVLLVHVLDAGTFLEPVEQVRSLLRKSAANRLVGVAARLRDAGAEVRTELLEGRPEAELARAATRPGVRLMVTGSLGHIAVSRLLIGSVAERTAEACPVPTLVVRDPERLVDWAEGRGPLNVFLAVDFSASAEAAIRWLKELRRIGPCNVVLGYADWPPEERHRLGLGGPVSLTQNPAEIQLALERDLRAKVKLLLGDTSVRVRVAPSWGTPDFQLLQMARQEQADLAVVGTHQRHGPSRLAHPSVSRALVHHAPMSVACVPSAFGASPAAAPIPEYCRVLVATDFSPIGNRAIPHAYSVLAHGGSVRLVHVRPPFAAPSPLVGRYERKPRTRKDHAKLGSELTARLREVIPGEAAVRGILTEVAVLEGGDVAQTICQEAERFGADLICIGSHGHSPVASAVLGSVAQKVTGHSRRPILVIRPPPA